MNIEKKKLLDKLRKDYNLSNDFKINIINPQGMIIMGRSNKLSAQQLKDFEIIKRKYKNVIDIMSYDDLLSILSRIITKFQGV